MTLTLPRQRYIMSAGDPQLGDDECPGPRRGGSHHGECGGDPRARAPTGTRPQRPQVRPQMGRHHVQHGK